MVLPARAPLPAWAPSPEPPPIRFCGPASWLDPADPFSQSFPKVGLMRPPTVTELPQTLTGMSIGTETELPDSTPGEPVAAEAAPASAWA